MGDQLILNKKSKDLNTLYTGEECWTLFGATLRSPSIPSPLGAMRGPLGGISRYFRETWPLPVSSTLHEVPSRYQPGFKECSEKQLRKCLPFSLWLNTVLPFLYSFPLVLATKLRSLVISFLFFSDDELATNWFSLIPTLRASAVALFGVYVSWESPIAI
jgi:hypothetical protein